MTDVERCSPKEAVDLEFMRAVSAMMRTAFRRCQTKLRKSRCRKSRWKHSKIKSPSLGTASFSFPTIEIRDLKHVRTAWRKALKRAGAPYFRIYDLRSTYATRLSAGGVADEWVIQMLRQGDSQVFKKYSQMKLQMKREALDKINRRANEMSGVLTQRGSGDRGFDTVLTQ